MSLVDELTAIVGPENVVLDPGERAFLSMDAFWSAAVAEAAVRPGTVEELAAVVRAATGSGRAVIARGGGMSYTSGYVPERADSILIDTRRLDRILEINEEDMYVTAECGCTWRTLYEALRARGLRTPYFGPMSGILATVGGTLSNNSMFYGSGVHGTVAESVLGLRVVLADGRILTTGSRANRGRNPFHRPFGPDLTGLFLSDTGALGVKAEASLRLIPAPSALAFASFAYDDFGAMFEAQAEIARTRLAAECFGLDPFLNRNLAEPADAGQALRALKHVALARGSLLGGLRDALRVALAGPRVLQEVAYSLHVTVEGPHAPGVRASLDAVRRIALGHGREVEATLPRVVRADPFQSVGQFLVGKHGERWVPIHACLPLSKVRRAFATTQDYLGSRKQTLDAFRIQTSLLTAVAGTDFIFEPAFYYPDAPTPFQLRHVEPADRERLASQPAVPGANEAVVGMLRDLARIFLELGAVHQQIGKFYPYREALEPNSLSVLEGVKRLLDPGGLVNPGSLGLR